jgi:hypothetical protein
MINEVQYPFPYKMQTVVGDAVESTLLDSDQRAAVPPTIIERIY